LTRYRLSPEAQDDLDEIRRYLVTQGGTRLARYVIHEIRDAISFLAANPGAGHRRDDLSDEAVKFWSVFSYMIVYDPVTRPLGIARVLHASRDLASLLKQRPPGA
jgi:toxin ParE1/3/4